MWKRGISKINADKIERRIGFIVSPFLHNYFIYVNL